MLGASGPFTAGDPGRMPRFALEFQFGPGTPAAGLISTGKKGYLTLEGQPFVLAAATYARMQRSYAASRDKGAAGGQERVGLAALGVDRPQIFRVYERMMGFPPGWTRLPPSETQSFPPSPTLLGRRYSRLAET